MPTLNGRAAVVKVEGTVHQFDSRTGIPDDTSSGVLSALRKMGALVEDEPEKTGPLGLAATAPENQPSTGGGGDEPAASIDVASASVEDLAKHISTGGSGGKALTVPQTVDLAGSEKEYAEKVLEAERLSTGDDPRQGVVDKLGE